MRVAITGTPGTGKSSVAEKVSKELKCPLFPIEDLVENYELYESYDDNRNSYIVDTKKLNKKLKKELNKRKNFILEGHLAHYFKEIDLLIILRANPTELKKRLESKGWISSKVVENVQAEILDVILQESVPIHKNICEIETSKRPISSVVQEIVTLIKNPDSWENYQPGKIDWSGYSSYF